MNSYTKVIVVASSLFFVGCAGGTSNSVSSLANKLTGTNDMSSLELSKNLKRGKSTKQDVAELMGDPTTIASNGGYEIWTYTGFQENGLRKLSNIVNSAASYVPATSGLSSVVSKTSSTLNSVSNAHGSGKSVTYIVTFDKNGKLKDYVVQSVRN